MTKLNSTITPDIKAVDAGDVKKVTYTSNSNIDPDICDGQNVPNLSFFRWKKDIEESLPKSSIKFLCFDIFIYFVTIFLGFFMPIVYVNFTKTNVGIFLFFAILVVIFLYYKHHHNSLSADRLNGVLFDMSKFKEPGENNNAS